MCKINAEFTLIYFKIIETARKKKRTLKTHHAETNGKSENVPVIYTQ